MMSKDYHQFRKYDSEVTSSESKEQKEVQSQEQCQLHGLLVLDQPDSTESERIWKNKKTLNRKL